MPYLEPHDCKMAECVADTPLEMGEVDLSCICCGQEVSQLKCLPCLHPVGISEKKDCQRRIALQRISCLQCNEVFEVGSGGLPPHSLAARQVLKREQKKKGLFCLEEHEEPQAAVVYCSDCPGPLCEECRAVHHSLKVLKKHKLVSVNEALAGGLAEPGESSICPTHKEPLKFYCQDCQGMVCMACRVVGAHQPHTVVFVNGMELGETDKQPFVHCIKSAVVGIEKMAASVQAVDNQLVRLHQEGNRCKQDVVELKDYIIEAVTTRCALLIAEVEEVEQKRRNDLEEHKKALQHQMNRLEQFKTSTEEIVREGTAREQLSVRKVMVQRMSTLSSTPTPPPPPSSSSIHFVGEKRADLEKVLSTMGRVSRGAHPPSCTTEGLPVADDTVECRPWGRPLSFTVVARDHTGSQCLSGGENVQAVLTPTTCGAPVSGQVEDNRDGTYQVEFKCVPSNQSKLVVTVNEGDIKGCPVKVVTVSTPTVKEEIRDPENERRSYVALSLRKDGSLLATDVDNDEVCIFNKNGKLIGSFEVALNLGSDIVELSDDNIAVSYCEDKSIKVYTPHGELVKEFGSDELEGPLGLAVNNKGQLFVVDTDKCKVFVYSEDGEFQYSFGSRGSDLGEFECPVCICIGQDGLVYVGDFGDANNGSDGDGDDSEDSGDDGDDDGDGGDVDEGDKDGGHSRVLVFQQDGQFIQQFGEDVLESPQGIATTEDGHIVVTSSDTNKLSIFTPSGECVHEVKDVGLSNPCGVVVDKNGFTFVADRDNHRIIKL